MHALRMVFRVILHLLQALLLLSAVAGGVILLISWIQQEAPLIGSVDDIDEWIAFVIITGILSVAVSPMLWSSYRKGPVAAAAAPVSPPSPAAPAPMAAPGVGQTYGSATVSAPGPVTPVAGMPHAGTYGAGPVGPAEQPESPPMHGYPPPAGQPEPPPRWPSSPP